MRIPFRTKDPYKLLESILTDFNEKGIDELLDTHSTLLSHPEMNPIHPDMIEFYERIDSRLVSLQKNLKDERDSVMIRDAAELQNQLELMKNVDPKIESKVDQQNESIISDMAKANAAIEKLAAAAEKMAKEAAAEKEKSNAAAKALEAAEEKKAKEVEAKHEAKLKSDIERNLICPHCHAGGDWFVDVPNTPKEETTRLETMGLVRRNCKHCNKKSTFSLSIE